MEINTVLHERVAALEAQRREHAERFDRLERVGAAERAEMREEVRALSTSVTTGFERLSADISKVTASQNKALGASHLLTSLLSSIGGAGALQAIRSLLGIH